MRTTAIASLAGVALLGLVTAGVGSAQTKEQSPADLIRFLTYQSDRPPSFAQEFGQLSCGSEDAEAHDSRAAAASLARLGASALPSLEGALDSIEKKGERSEFSSGAPWLLYAYAKIEGPAAFSRLRRMIARPRLNFFQAGLDNAIALSLGLTSYVSSSRRVYAGETIYCDGKRLATYWISSSSRGKRTIVRRSRRAWDRTPKPRCNRCSRGEPGRLCARMSGPESPAGTLRWDTDLTMRGD